MVCRSVNSRVKCDLAKQRAGVTLLQQQLKLLWSFFKKAPLLSVSPRMLGFNLSDERFEHKYDIFAVRRQLNTVTTEGRLNHIYIYIYNILKDFQSSKKIKNYTRLSVGLNTA